MTIRSENRRLGFDLDTYSTRCVITSETGFAHSGTIINNELFEGEWAWIELAISEANKIKTYGSNFVFHCRLLWESQRVKARVGFLLEVKAQPIAGLHQQPHQLWLLMTDAELSKKKKSLEGAFTDPL